MVNIQAQAQAKAVLAFFADKPARCWISGSETIAPGIQASDIEHETMHWLRDLGIIAYTMSVTVFYVLGSMPGSAKFRL